MPDSIRQTDAELVSAHLGGDTAAFASIYDRYGDRVYSYCLSMLRSVDDAADATQDTFIKMAARLDQLRDGDKLRPWLFAIARNEARAEGRRRSRLVPEEDLTESLVEEPDFAMAIQQEQLRTLVWEASEGLSTRDQELMALHLTEGLDGDDLAEAMGVEKAHLHVMVSRMKDRVEMALGALLIATLGNEDCAELDEVLADWDGKFSVAVRSRVARHVGKCDSCKERRAFLVAPANILPSIMLVPAPVALRGRILDAVSAPAPAVVAPPPADTPKGNGKGLSELAMIGIFAAVTLVVGLIGLAVAASIDPLPATSTLPVAEPIPEPSSTTTTIPGTTSTTSPAQSTTTSAAPAVPGSIEVASGTVDFGDSATSGAIGLSNPGGQPVAFEVMTDAESISLASGGGDLGPGESIDFQVALDRSTVKEGPISEAITITWEGGEIVVEAIGVHEDNPIIHNPRATPSEVMVDGGSSCFQTRTTISARIRDTSEFDAIVRWSPDGRTTVESQMSHTGNEIYAVEIGPFSAAQNAEAKIVATDELGNAGGATIVFSVVACS